MPLQILSTQNLKIRTVSRVLSPIRRGCKEAEIITTEQTRIIPRNLKSSSQQFRQNSPVQPAFQIQHDNLTSATAKKLEDPAINETLDLANNEVFSKRAQQKLWTENSFGSLQKTMNEHTMDKIQEKNSNFKLDELCAVLSQKIAGAEFETLENDDNFDEMHTEIQSMSDVELYLYIYDQIIEQLDERFGKALSQLKGFFVEKILKKSTQYKAFEAASIALDARCNKLEQINNDLMQKQKAFDDLKRDMKEQNERQRDELLKSAMQVDRLTDQYAFLSRDNESKTSQLKQLQKDFTTQSNHYEETMTKCKRLQLLEYKNRQIGTKAQERYQLAEKTLAQYSQQNFQLDLKVGELSAQLMQAEKDIKIQQSAMEDQASRFNLERTRLQTQVQNDQGFNFNIKGDGLGILAKSAVQSMKKLVSNQTFMGMANVQPKEIGSLVYVFGHIMRSEIVEEFVKAIQEDKVANPTTKSTQTTVSVQDMTQQEALIKQFKMLQAKQKDKAKSPEKGAAADEGESIMGETFKIQDGKDKSKLSKSQRLKLDASPKNETPSKKDEKLAKDDVKSTPQKLLTSFKPESPKQQNSKNQSENEAEKKPNEQVDSKVVEYVEPIIQLNNQSSVKVILEVENVVTDSNNAFNEKAVEQEVNVVESPQQGQGEQKKDDRLERNETEGFVNLSDTQVQSKKELPKLQSEAEQPAQIEKEQEQFTKAIRKSSDIKRIHESDLVQLVAEKDNQTPTMINESQFKLVPESPKCNENQGFNQDEKEIGNDQAEEQDQQAEDLYDSKRKINNSRNTTKRIINDQLSTNNYYLTIDQLNHLKSIVLNNMQLSDEQRLVLQHLIVQSELSEYQNQTNDMIEQKINVTKNQSKEQISQKQVDKSTINKEEKEESVEEIPATFKQNLSNHEEINMHYVIETSKQEVKQILCDIPLAQYLSQKIESYFTAQQKPKHKIATTDAFKAQLKNIGELEKALQNMRRVEQLKNNDMHTSYLQSAKDYLIQMLSSCGEQEINNDELARTLVVKTDDRASRPTSSMNSIHQQQVTQQHFQQEIKQLNPSIFQGLSLIQQHPFHEVVQKSNNVQYLQKIFSEKTFTGDHLQELEYQFGESNQMCFPIVMKSAQNLSLCFEYNSSQQQQIFFMYQTKVRQATNEAESVSQCPLIPKTHEEVVYLKIETNSDSYFKICTQYGIVPRIQTVQSVQYIQLPLKTELKSVQWLVKAIEGILKDRVQSHVFLIQKLGEDEKEGENEREKKSPFQVIPGQISYEQATDLIQFCLYYTKLRFGTQDAGRKFIFDLYVALHYYKQSNFLAYITLELINNRYRADFLLLLLRVLEATNFEQTIQQSQMIGVVNAVFCNVSDNRKLQLINVLSRDGEITQTALLQSIFCAYTVLRKMHFKNALYLFQFLIQQQNLKKAELRHFKQLIELCNVQLTQDSICEYFYEYSDSTYMDENQFAQFYIDIQAGRFMLVKGATLKGIISTKVANSTQIISKLVDKFGDFWGTLQARGIIQLECQESTLNEQNRDKQDALVRKKERIQNISLALEQCKNDLELFDAKAAVKNLQVCVNESVKLLNQGNGGVLVVSMDSQIELLMDMIGY